MLTRIAGPIVSGKAQQPSNEAMITSCEVMSLQQAAGAGNTAITYLATAVEKHADSPHVKRYEEPALINECLGMHWLVKVSGVIDAAICHGPADNVPMTITSTFNCDELCLTRRKGDIRRFRWSYSAPLVTLPCVFLK